MKTCIIARIPSHNQTIVSNMESAAKVGVVSDGMDPRSNTQFRVVLHLNIGLCFDTFRFWHQGSKLSVTHRF